MPVRDSSEWRHAILQKKVINLDHAGDRNIMCAWDTCTNDGYESFKVRVRTHAEGEPEFIQTKDGNYLPNFRYMNYVFCTERHKRYWLESIHPGRFGHLPKGYRLSIL
jgi:hypothetical protein